MWGAAPRTRLVLAFAAALALFALLSPGAAPSAADTQAPTAPTNLRLTAATATTLTVAWDASTDDIGVAGYNLYLWSTKVGTTNSTSYTFTGLKCGTKYRLQVAAYDAAGNASALIRSTRIDRSTSACSTGDTQAPTTPTNLHVTATGQTSVSLAWTASTDNVGVTAYGVYSGSTAVGTAASTSYTVTGLSCAKSYTFAVDAADAAGNRSMKTTQVNAVTSDCALVGDKSVEPNTDFSPAGEAYAARSVASAGGQINQLSIYLDPANAATGVKLAIYRDGNGQPSTLMGSGTVSSVQDGAWNSAGISPVSITGGTAYWIAVLGTGGTLRYRNQCCGGGSPVTTAAGSLTAMPATWSLGVYSGGDGPLSAYGDWSANSAPAPVPPPDTQAPSIPTNLNVTAGTTTSLTVGWTASTDNVGVTGYGVYNGSTIAGSTSSTSYAVNGLTCGTSYTLAVDAYDAAGNRSGKASLTASTSDCPLPAVDTQAPTVPTGLQVTGTTGASISIAWTSSTDNVGVTGYGVYDGSTTLGTSKVPSYTVSGLNCGTAYTFSVDAYDAAGNHSAKALLTASTSTCPPLPGSGAQVGDTALESQTDQSPAGEVYASRTTASTGGQVNELRVYLDSGNAATTVLIGLYSDAGSQPGTLLASGAVPAVQDGAWNAAGITPVTVTTGTTYWIAVLGTGGTLHYRNRCCGGGSPVLAAQGTQSSLPASWTANAYSGGDGPLSAYGDWTGNPPVADTSAPSTPTGLVISSTALNGVTLSWTASSDDVAVAGYGVYVGSNKVADTSSIPYQVTGLSCGTSYSFSVDAYDAAGNRSQPTAALISSTAPCPPLPTGGGNVYVAPSGNDTTCVRGDATKPCASFGKAYQLAQPGDTVLVANGSYGPQRVCRGGSPTCSGSAAEKGTPAITFRAQTPHGATLHGVVGGGEGLTLGNALGGGSNPPSNLVFDGIDIEGQISETGDFNTGNPKGHDITFRNGHVYQVKEWAHPNQGLVEESQVDSLHLEHMEIGPGCCRGDAIYGGLANNNVANDFEVTDSSIHDLYDSCKYVPAAINSQYGPCDPVGNCAFGDGCGYDHVDGIDLWGGNNLKLLRNKWYAIGANGDPVGQSIFLYADSTGNCGSFDGIDIENNAVYAGDTKNNTVSMGLSGGFACTPGLKNIKVLYNTIWASNSNGFGNLSIGDVAAGTSIVVAGNIIKSTAGNSSTCAVGVKGGGTLMPVYRNNLIGNRTCDPSDHQGTPTFVRSDPLNPDQHLSQNGQWAIDHGEATYCPGTDLLGNSRPIGAACDMGAYEGP